MVAEQEVADEARMQIESERQFERRLQHRGEGEVIMEAEAAGAIQQRRMTPSRGTGGGGGCHWDIPILTGVSTYKI